MKRTLLHVAEALCLLLFVSSLVLSATPAGQDDESRSKAKRGWLGVSISDVTEDIAKEKNLKSETGAYVSDVVDDSPADSVGLKKGDVVVEFSGKAIEDANDLSKAVSRVEPGTKANLVVLRKGEKKTFQVVIGKLPRRSRNFGYFFNDHEPRMRIFHGGMLGMGLLELNEQLAEYFGAPNNEGVLVEQVEKGRSAEKAGIKAGDVLLKIGSRSIDEIDDVRRALDKYEEGDKVDVEVLRKGSRKTMSVEVEEDEGPWGITAPRMGPGPRIHMFKGPEWRDLDFDMEIMEPKLDELRYRIESIAPEIEGKVKRFELPLQRKIRAFSRTISI